VYSKRAAKISFMCAEPLRQCNCDHVLLLPAAKLAVICEDECTCMSRHMWALTTQYTEYSY
jgi:hypothetical protein